MRAARPALVAVIGIAAVLFVAAPALAATSPRLMLSASHGPAGDSVTATFSYSNSWGWFGPTCDGPVTFRWDGRSVAQARPGWDGRSCSASVTLTPPSNVSGSHVVKGSAPGMGSAEATYTIDSESTPSVTWPAPPAAPSPAAAPGSVRIASTPQNAQPSPAGRSAQPSQSARPTPSAGSPTPSASAAPGLAGPTGTATPDDPRTLVAMDAPAVVVRPAVSTPMGVWVLMAGGALILFGAGLVGAVRLFRRRRRVAFSL